MLLRAAARYAMITLIYAPTPRMLRAIFDAYFTRHGHTLFATPPL